MEYHNRYEKSLFYSYLYVLPKYYRIEKEYINYQKFYTLIQYELDGSSTCRPLCKIMPFYRTDRRLRISRFEDN